MVSVEAERRVSFKRLATTIAAGEHDGIPFNNSAAHPQVGLQRYTSGACRNGIGGVNERDRPGRCSGDLITQ